MSYIGHNNTGYAKRHFQTPRQRLRAVFDLHGYF